MSPPTLSSTRPKTQVTFHAEPSAACLDCGDESHAHEVPRGKPSKSQIKDPERYKTVPCKNWKATGRCPYGPRCQFAHGAHDLRVRTAAALKPASKSAALEPYLPTPSPSPPEHAAFGERGAVSADSIHGETTQSALEPPVPLPANMVHDLVGQEMPRKLSWATLWEDKQAPQELMDSPRDIMDFQPLEARQPLEPPRALRSESLSKQINFDPDTGSVVCTRQASHSTTLLATSLAFLFDTSLSSAA